jgi:predicted metalloprotease with PDZ domain
MRSARLIAFGVLILWACAALAGPETLQVDLRDAPRGLFHSDMSFSVRPGPLTLVYPRWIPGDHLPSGPIDNVAGLVFRINGKVLPWRRDPYEDDEFHIIVPSGADRLDVHLDFLAVPRLVTVINQESKATTDNFALLRWHVVTLYPAEATAATYEVSPSVILPPGWACATALGPGQRRGDIVYFGPTDLQRLIDSPLVAGRYQRTYTLTPTQTTTPHRVIVTAEDPVDLEMTAEQRRHLSSTIDQAEALFESEPFRGYDFLVTVSSKLRQSVGMGGQEHQESSDNTAGAGIFRDPAGQKSLGETLAHEYTHSWNGKYRRPIGEMTRNYQQPYDDSLLWVYEGLTEYLGQVLAVRSGAWSEQEFRDALADSVASMMAQEGREWRPLIDTSVGLQALMHASIATWGNWRRGIDYYAEGALLWMDVDLKIRRLTRNRRSLDDFCRIFFAKGPSDPAIKPYNFADIVAALNKVTPADWRAFLLSRLDSVNSSMPMEVLPQAGWLLAFRENVSPYLAGDESDGTVNATYSIGLKVAPGGVIEDVRMHFPADAAGLAPGMKILSIEGRTYSSAELRTAIDEGGKIAVTFANGDAVRSAVIVCSGGQKYPFLRRASGPDLIAEIARPLPLGVRK